MPAARHRSERSYNVAGRRISEASGTMVTRMGAKAGGPDYLLQFTVPRCITENTMRRGFAPVTE